MRLEKAQDEAASLQAQCRNISRLATNLSFSLVEAVDRPGMDYIGSNAISDRQSTRLADDQEQSQVYKDYSFRLFKKKSCKRKREIIPMITKKETIN